jgi:DNA replication and repair protein RecF
VIFEKGINYLFGVNGIGKTNLIEAIYYVSNLKSFRTSDDKNLIKDFKGEAIIEAEVDGLSYVLKIHKDKKIYL